MKHATAGGRPGQWGQREKQSNSSTAHCSDIRRRQRARTHTHTHTHTRHTTHEHKRRGDQCSLRACSKYSRLSCKNGTSYSKGPVPMCGKSSVVTLSFATYMDLQRRWQKQADGRRRTKHIRQRHDDYTTRHDTTRHDTQTCLKAEGRKMECHPLQIVDGILVQDHAWPGLF
jgi:hypothetical protein